MSRLLHARSWMVLAFFAAHALGCATSAEGPGAPIAELDPDADPQADEGTSAIDDIGGETGSMGGRECLATSDCLEQAEMRVASLTEPLVLDRQLIGAECVARDENDSENCCYYDPAVCLCYYGWDGSQTRDRGNALILGNRQDCDEYGRDQSCISPAADFEGCDVDDASSCDAACDALDTKLAAHYAQTFDAEVRSAGCTDNGYCRIVLRIEEQCYASFSPTTKAYDCGLSDEEILADAYPPSAPSSCTSDVCDAGAAVQSDASTQ